MRVSTHNVRFQMRPYRWPIPESWYRPEIFDRATILSVSERLPPRAGGTRWWRP